MTENQSVEDEITGRFMRKLRESDVAFDVVEAIEPLTSESDFGGREKLAEATLETIEEDATKETLDQ